MIVQNYYSIGKKYGIAFKDEVIESIYTGLEKQVSAFIYRCSKKYAPVEVTLSLFQGENQRNESSDQEPGNDYERIIYARAASNRRKSAKERQKACEDALQAHKVFLSTLEAFVKKAERKSDWDYQRFLLGTARHSTFSDHLPPIRFKSQVYQKYKEKLSKETGHHEI